MRRHEKRDEVLAFIRQHHQAHGYAPSVREIAAGVNLCKATAHYHLEKLEEAGHIRRGDGAARAIALVSVEGVGA